jgi:hypothetical protein
MNKNNYRKKYIYLVAGAVPVADEHGVLVGRQGERDGDERAAADTDRAEPAGGLVERQRREVEEAADLVLGLHAVREVLAWGDRAVRAGHAVLPRVLALLQTVPVGICDETKQNQLTFYSWRGGQMS